MSLKVLTVKENDVGLRLDNFISKQFAYIPKSLIYKFIRSKKIKVNNKKVDFNYKLLSGDIINCFFSINSQQNIANQHKFILLNQKLDVVYEDKNLLIVNKPINMLVYDEQNKEVNTLINHVWKYLFEKGEYNPNLENSFKPYLAHRIDQNTSGLVVVGKNRKTLNLLNEIFKNNWIRRFYICLVHGLVKNKKKTIINYIKKENKFVKISNFAENNEYKKAVTKYELIDYLKNKYSLLDIELLTGKTHQIRATMNYINYPLVGEQKYTQKNIDKDLRFKSQCLVSYKLKFLNLEGTHLDYLSNKEFKLNSIWFLEFLGYKKR